MSKINLKLDFEAIRERIEKDKSLYKPSIWADRVGVSRNIVTNVHGAIKQQPSLEYIVAVSKATEKSVDYYLWGKEEGSSTLPNSDPVVIEHQNIIKQFYNPAVGKRINEKLVVIQKNEKIFQGIINSIKAAFETVEAIEDSKAGRTGGDENLKNGTE